MVLVGTSCFDEVIVAETVVSVSQFMKKFYLFFYHTLADLIFLFFFTFSSYRFISR